LPSPRRRLEAADVETYVRQRCFSPSREGLVGIELERHVTPTHRHGAVDHRALQRVCAALDLPGGGRITFEPGGQLELSSPPCRGPSAACAVVDADLAVLDPAVEALGVRLVAQGLRPEAGDELVVASPRYLAMAAYLDQAGRCGRTMMCATAALQVNLDTGGESDQARRWRLAHQLGPVLLACFANSPLPGPRTGGWRSGRSAAWAGIDPSRTLSALDGSDDPAATWTRYALDARVMLIRVSGERFEPVLSPLPFGAWLHGGHELGFPTLEDLEYHLGTLFPPVRARGWLELRMVDALPPPWWRVAAAVCAALLDDPEAADAAGRASAPAAGLWTEAAQHALAHPALAGAARQCFAAALAALPRLRADEATVAAVAAYAERFVAPGRCPADETLAAAGSTTRALEASWS